MLCSFRVLQDGNILLKHRPSKWKQIDDKISYCVDGLQNYPISTKDGAGTLSGFYSGLEIDTLLIECAMPLPSESGEDPKAYVSAMR